MFAFLFLWLQAATPDQVHHQAIELMAQQRYGDALPLLMAVADQPNPPRPIYFQIGLMHQNGWGTDEDQGEACRWFIKAADRKVPYAEHLAGDCLSDGIGGTLVDMPRALGYYLSAGSASHPWSLCRAADFYLTGRAVAKDPGRGLALCREASDRGVEKAHIRMAEIILSGAAGSPEPLLALGFLKRGIDQGSAEAAWQAAQIMNEFDLTPEDLPSCQSLTEQAALGGIAPAYFAAAKYYLDRLMVAADGEFIANADLANAYLWLNAVRRADTGDRDRAAALLPAITDALLEQDRRALDQRLDRVMAKK